MSVNPPFIDIETSGGEDHIVHINVKNTSDQEKEYLLTAVSLELSEDEAPVFKELNDQTEVILDSEVMIPPFQEKDIPLVIRTFSIENQVIIGIQITEKHSAKETGVSVQEAFLVPIFISQSELQHQFEILDIQFVHQREEGQLSISHIVKNPSDFIVQPQAEISVEDLFGRTLLSTSLNPGNKHILSGKTHQFVTHWDYASHDPSFLRRLWENPIGPVHIITKYTDKNGIIKEEKSSSIWFFPLESFFAIGGSLLLLVGVFIFQYKLNRN